MKTKNTILFGLMLGLIAPAVIMGIGYLFVENDFSFYVFLVRLKSMGTLMKVVSLSCLINLLFFYYYLNREAYLTVKGLIFSVIIYGLLTAGFTFL